MVVEEASQLEDFVEGKDVTALLVDQVGVFTNARGFLRLHLGMLCFAFDCWIPPETNCARGLTWPPCRPLHSIESCGLASA